MNQEPHPVARQGAKRDGLAAVAIILLTVLLLALVVSQIV